MQVPEKQNFLKVCFNSHKGLKLNWNFGAVNNREHYFRHIFVLTAVKQDQNFKIIDFFYRKMKSGDLFCCIYPHDSYEYKLGRWVQKSQLSSFKAERYLTAMSKRSLDKTLKSKIIDRVGKEASQFNQPVLVNFLGVQKHQVEFYRNEVMAHRSAIHPSYQYIVNLFGDFEQNSVSVHSGFNLLQSNTKIDVLSEYYHKLVNSATVQNAKIDILSLDGQMSLFNEVYWRSSDFNRISATYYGPSSSFEQQTIYFFTSSNNFSVEHEFEVRLKIKLFQNRILQSVKKIKINFNQQKQYFPTFSSRVPHQYYHYNNIFLSQNPNRCDMIVKFKSNKEKHQQNI